MKTIMISTFQHWPATEPARSQSSPIWIHARFARGAGVGRYRQNHDSLQLPEIRLAREEDHWDMARLVAGDDGAMNCLMQRHAKRLRRYLTRITKNSADAAELVQETFVRVFRHRAKFDYDHRFSTWLYTIASHLAIDLLRRHARQLRHLSLPQNGEDNAEEMADTLVDPSPTPSERLEADERTRALDDALARLPDKLRLPLVLVVFGDSSQADAATRLGCSTKAVEMRLYHARERLRAEFAKNLEPPGPGTNSWHAESKRAPAKKGRVSGKICCGACIIPGVTKGVVERDR